jgi:hypothetical protein
MKLSEKSVPTNPKAAIDAPLPPQQITAPARTPIPRCRIPLFRQLRSWLDAWTGANGGWS